MLKLRLKRIGRKKKPFYRIIVIESRTRLNGKTIDELGFYDALQKSIKISKSKTLKWLNYGVKPTNTVLDLLKKSNILD